MLPGPGNEGDPLGLLHAQRGGGMQLTARTGVVIEHRAIGGVRRARILVHTVFGMLPHDMPRDESKLTAPSWHTYIPDIPDLP